MRGSEYALRRRRLVSLWNREVSGTRLNFEERDCPSLDNRNGVLSDFGELLRTAESPYLFKLMELVSIDSTLRTDYAFLLKMKTTLDINIWISTDKCGCGICTAP